MRDWIKINPGLRLGSTMLVVAIAVASSFDAAPVVSAGDAPSAVGVTEAVFDVTLSLAVPGIITQQKFKEGDSVTTNDVILQLDSRIEELEVERYRLVMENKQVDWESTRKVFDKTTSVSHDELLKKEADYRVAAAEHQLALEQLSRRKLTSPAEGVITEIKLHVGEACAAYQPIVRVVDSRRCYFVSNVDAPFASRVKLGQKVSLEFDDAGGSGPVAATVVFISPVVDSASGLQKIKAVFENPDGKTPPGASGRMFVKKTEP